MPRIRTAIRKALEVEVIREVAEGVALSEKIDENYKKKAFKVPSSLPAEVGINVNSWSTLTLSMPANTQLMELVRQRFITKGWVMEPFKVDEYKQLMAKGWIPDPKYPDSDYRHQNTVVLRAQDYKEGSNCRIVEIGSTLKSVPIYERRCDEEGAGVLDALDRN